MGIQKMVWPVILGCLCGLWAGGATIALVVISGVEICYTGVLIIILSTLSAAFGLIGFFVGLFRYHRWIRSSAISSLKLESLPRKASDYIMSVGRYMSYRLRVRLEVMNELAGHFDNELKNCTTDEEKEQKAQKLIEQFGDAKLLGILLRRAKKRCRPLWRTVVARTFQTIGVLILCLIIYLVWFFTGKPVITTNYIAELNRIVRPTADESLNAAPLYNKAAEIYSKLPDDIFKPLGGKYDEANDADRQAMEKLLGDHKETLDLVTAGTKKPYFWESYKSCQGNEMMGLFLPNVSEYRKLAYSLCWRAHFRARENRFEEAFDDIKSCYRLGRHLRGDTSLIEQLVGIAIQGLALQELRSILSQNCPDSALLAKLEQNFEQMTSNADSTISLKTERLCMYDEIQRCFTADHIGGGHLYFPRIIQISLAGESFPNKKRDDTFGKIFQVWLNVIFTHPNKQQTLKSINELYGDFEKESLKNPVQRHAEKAQREKEFNELVSNNLFIGTLCPALEKVVEINHRLPTDVRATQTIIAVLRYRQDKGRLPENLEQLVTAGYLKKLPIDPFSDKLFVYKKTGDNFLLYSIGSNFTDDGGKVARNDKGKVKKYADQGDWVFWPVQN